MDNGKAGTCEPCGKEIHAGQPVQLWDDIGSAHFCCENPWSIPSPIPEPSPDDGGPLYVYLGEPLKPLALLRAFPNA